MPGRLYRAYLLLRKISLWGPTKEEIGRMDREDREANTEWIPGTGFGILHGTMKFGDRVDLSDDEDEIEFGGEGKDGV